jgi:hypothetical protein
VVNPYLKPARPNIFTAASTPQPKPASAVSVTPGSSAKKQRATTVSSTKHRSKKGGTKFILSNYELYKPFREDLLRFKDDGADAGVDAAGIDVVPLAPDVDANINLDNSADDDIFFDADEDLVGDDDVDEDVEVALDSAVDADVDPVMDAEVDNDEFDTKAFSLMRNHFLHTRTTAKKKESYESGRSLRSDLIQNDFNEECDEEALEVTTTNTRRLSRYMLEDFITLPASTRLLLMIPITESPWSAMAKLGLECQPTASVVRMGGIEFYKVTGHILSANLALELTSGYLSESQLNTCFNQNDGVSIGIDGVSSFQLSWKQFVTNPSDILIFGAPVVTHRDFYRSFRRLNTTPSVHKLWRQLFHETFGDAFQSLLVYSSYLKRRCEIGEKENVKLSESASKYDGIASSIALLINKKDGLLKRFNTRCRNSISHTITTFQDFSKRLITIEHIDKFVQLVKRRASALFQVFATLRKIDYIRKKNSLET